MASAPASERARPSAEPREGAVTPVGQALHVQVPSVGVDTAVLPITPQGGVLDPPSLTAAYVIERYGAPGSDNTVYLAGHSWDSGEAVFNPLFDRAAQSARVREGDEVVVTTAAGRYTYVVERAERYPRASLPDRDEVWDAVPGRLVLITCFQRDDGRNASDNLVVYAQLDRTEALT